MTPPALADTLIALDVDGTLLAADGTLSGRTVDALAAAAASGATLTLATGRDWAAVRDLLELVPSVGYSVCVNGTEVVTSAGELLYAEELDADVAKVAIGVLREALPGVSIGLGIGGELVGDARLKGQLPAAAAPVVEVGDVAEAVAPGLRDLLVYHPDFVEDLETLYDACVRALPTEGVEVAYAGLPMIEIIPPGSGKDTGTAWLAGHLGVPGDRVIAFGDGLNDLALLAWAGTGVAMGQAAAAVIDAADEVTASSDDDGVAVWIEGRLT